MDSVARTLECCCCDGERRAVAIGIRTGRHGGRGGAGAHESRAGELAAIAARIRSGEDSDAGATIGAVAQRRYAAARMRRTRWRSRKGDDRSVGSELMFRFDADLKVYLHREPIDFREPSSRSTTANVIA